MPSPKHDTYTTDYIYSLPEGTKMNLYGETGAREYRIVDPSRERTTV